MKRVLIAFFLAVSVFGFSGCDLYDQLISTLKRAFSNDEYDVSVIDCVVVTADRRIVPGNDVFSRKMSNGMREGVQKLSQKPKMRHIQLVDRVPPSEFRKANDVFCDGELDLRDQCAHFQQLSKRYSTNILLFGQTVPGDATDAGYFCGWLYRRDLNMIAGKPAMVKFTHNMPERAQREQVAEAVAQMLENSLADNDPTGIGDIFDDEEVKNFAITTALTLLSNYAASAAGGDEE